MKNKPVKSGLAKARATTKHSRIAPLSHKDLGNSKKKSLDNDFPWDETKVRKPKEQSKDKSEDLIKSVKKSRKEVLEVFESLTGESNEDFDDDVTERQALLKAKFSELTERIKQDEMLNPELIIKDLYLTILTTTIDLLPLAEKAYRNSKKESAAYAYTNLADKIQQLAADIRVLKDTSGQATVLVENVIQPLFLSLTTIIIQEVMSLKAEIDAVLAGQPKRATKLKGKADRSARNLAEFMNKATLNIHEKTEAFLSGALTLSSKPSKNRTNQNER
jgi:hypothetical protein